MMDVIWSKAPPTLKPNKLRIHLRQVSRGVSALVRSQLRRDSSTTATKLWGTPCGVLAGWTKWSQRWARDSLDHERFVRWRCVNSPSLIPSSTPWAQTKGDKPRWQRLTSWLILSYTVTRLASVQLITSSVLIDRRHSYQSPTHISNYISPLPVELIIQ